MFLSIIIPIFNAENYIKECVNSLVNLPQHLGIRESELEVILVDDGSKDNSGAICDELGNIDYPFDIKIVHQKNQGVSVARNEGLNIATGEWVWFMDADDYIEIPTKQITPIVVKDEQFVVTGFIWEENGKLETFDANNGEIPYNLWRCWFRSNLIRQYGVSFTVGRKYAEDQEFILKYLISIGETSSMALSNLHYHYTMRPGSAMTRKGVKAKQTRDLFLVLMSLLFVGMKKRIWAKGWYWKEIKRMTKTLIVVLSR